jgi:AAA+ ATPase superfamily predicted ATPase
MKFLKKLLIIFFFVISISACKTISTVKVEDFKVNINSPQSVIGEIELQLDTLMGIGPIKKQTVTLLYFPREDVICLRYIYEFYTYNQFWDKRGRLIFINALQKYNEDYEARNLQRNSIKSMQKYGTVRGYLVWQLISYTVQLYGNMNVDLGYTFKDRSPYFSVYQREAEFINELIGDDNAGPGEKGKSGGNNRTSPDITMYFTRAQAAELAEIFEQYIVPDNHLPDEYEEIDIPSKKDNIPRDKY